MSASFPIHVKVYEFQVASFTGEKRAVEKYNDRLRIARQATVKQGMVSGLGLGTVVLIAFCTYGLAVWYGSRLIIEKGYNGGQVINVIMAIMTGGMYVISSGFKLILSP